MQWAIFFKNQLKACGSAGMRNGTFSLPKQHCLNH